MSTTRFPPVWLAALLVVLAFAFQGTRAIWEPDEGRYTTTALNMISSGDWIVPTIDGEHAHLTKPPITYWGIATGVLLLGQNEWGARLSGALAFIGTGLLVFGLGRRFCPAKPWLPAVVYATSLAPFMAANVVSTDVVLVFFETAAMYAFVRAFPVYGEPDRRWVRAMWTLWGLAFMTKGPPGLLPLLAVAAMFATSRRLPVRRLFDPIGLLAFAVVGFTWFAAIVAQDPSRLGYFVGYEVYDRVFTAAHDRNAEWYGALLVYLPVFLFGALPWWPLALGAAGGPRRAWREFRDRLAARDPDWLLLAWWLLLPLAIFCLARSRLQLYVTPLFVPLSLMMARPLARWPWLQARRLALVAGATAAGLVALKGVVGHVHAGRDARAMAEALRPVVEARGLDEIVFVNMRPFYGIRVYLPVEVEGVQINEHRWDYSKFVAEEDLCDELAMRENSVYAMKQSRGQKFEDAVRACDGRTATQVGHFEADGNKIVLYLVE
ncbi:MAG: glycosyltransferase family 39 protein [Steroidobacteraceae bacterium]